MKNLNKIINITFLLFFCISSCAQKVNKNVGMFKETEAYELAKFVEKGDLNAIEKLIEADSMLLEVTNPISGSNVLTLAIYTENYDAFKKLLELGANPNFVNPLTKKSVLMESIKFYETPQPYTIDMRYTKLLLENGADPNYSIESDFTDKKGHYQIANTPLMQASKYEVEYVKLLIDYGANPNKKLKSDQATPLSSALNGYKNKFVIASYYIDSLNIDVHQPIKSYIRKSDNKKIDLYIQDYVINNFTKAKVFNDSKEIDRLKKENPNIEKFNEERMEFIQKLLQMGVDFKNYDYKK